LDVAHNPHAAGILARNLRAIPPTGRTHAVFSILADKDVAGTVAALADQVDVWWVAGLPGPRGRDAQQLADLVASQVSAPVHACPTPVDAWRAVRGQVDVDDKIVVFGSFLTVAEVLAEVDA
jgi:dihydrofolate synthase/folylpolyglutamate synthase